MLFNITGIRTIPPVKLKNILPMYCIVIFILLIIFFLISSNKCWIILISVNKYFRVLNNTNRIRSWFFIHNGMIHLLHFLMACF